MQVHYRKLRWPPRGLGSCFRCAPVQDAEETTDGKYCPTTTSYCPEPQVQERDVAAELRSTAVATKNFERSNGLERVSPVNCPLQAFPAGAKALASALAARAADRAGSGSSRSID